MAYSAIPLALSPEASTPRRAERLTAAQVGAQRLRHADGAVGPLVVLHQRDDGADRGQRGVVERVGVAHNTILAAVAQVSAAGLVVVEIRVRVCLAVAVLRG